MIVCFKKSFLKSAEARAFVRKSRLDYFKSKILEHLDRLEAKEKKEEQKVQKALMAEERLAKAGYPVGTVREWKGKKYMKVAPNKWRRKYDKEGKGTKLSLAVLKKSVNACTTPDGLLRIVLENRDRFKDADGKYLPFVKEMFEHVSKKHKEIKAAKNAGGKQASGGGKEEKPAVVRSPNIMAFRAKYESSPSIEGSPSMVVLPPDGIKVPCHYRIVEADAPTASHDEENFSPTEGFPTNEAGQNINDRNYQHDENAQEEVRRIAMDFNALAIANPPICNKRRHSAKRKQPHDVKQVRLEMAMTGRIYKTCARWRRKSLELRQVTLQASSTRDLFWR